MTPVGEPQSAANDDLSLEVDYSPRVQGELYANTLQSLHAILKPCNYLEIGTARGDTLRLATCPSIAVDPKFLVDSNVIGNKPICHLFQMTSDHFFRHHDPVATFGAPVDFAFLDGMHLFEFVLRDFINVERACRPNSVIAMHDCTPPGIYITVRSQTSPLFARTRFKGWWAGDVWKILPTLRHYRPDLRIVATDARPTGLVLITGLAPTSEILSQNYFEIVQKYSGSDLMTAEFDDLWASLELTSTSTLQRAEDVARHFWL